MYFIALATDYDGTLAHDGIVTKKTLSALEQLKKTGRKLILVTGRELPDLKRVFPELALFDKVVAENGALVYTPASEEERTISPSPSADLVAGLKKRGVKPLSVGRSIVATWEPHQATVLDVIKELGLELEIIFNKGAVMILPSGINKATGLAAALGDLRLSPRNAVGVGDAENDHAFLQACGCSVAVDNALPAVKNTADLVTRGARGKGVEELIGKLIKHDRGLVKRPRDGILLGTSGGKDVYLSPTDTVLIAGSSGIGKSTLATALTERFVETGYQFCIFDPEGDYDGLQGAVKLGDGSSVPTKEQLLDLIEKPDTNVVVNGLALRVNERPDFFADLLPGLGSFRYRTARPHWLVIDEAHHLLPKRRDDTRAVLSLELPGTVLITVHPEAISTDALRLVTAVIALGPKAKSVVRTFCHETGVEEPGAMSSQKGDRVLFWRPRNGKKPMSVKAIEPRQSLKRHSRKYAEGQLDEAGSFYFRGPDDAMNLRAHNLIIFAQMAEGIDDKTWEHHLRAGDYSEWFRHQIRDKDLARETETAEKDKTLSAQESRKRVLDAVRRRYTAPATAPVQ
ncbi:HAD-IIB family hydrolase [Mesorhizobium sp. M4B.F.Ca.ET.215.01.1.1]|uniref:HAD-IIB family hydrolase n=1 Tax=unclassified Mesorhizobium TaxID=325217 RepID=UPI000FCA3BD8|nr:MULTISPECIES: HAD family hydrolase [unclassified Mesorhizobium]RUW23497.1 HAD-IIB family hydrolase [Mesorhizobium sp. M4B.F.Ca.ET.013.02.1.1]RUW76527.1 HAD-IIB family hydrolase [Mesorhizobium sp. M4B.F.Ca.ET.049.02.1.2]RVD42586.1 HAD-IIB family hydrolase [Mesorhizobium sp. M4B.F.Ca.ET.019.03.1.1]TGQ14378.1 HAD-IIB family hydrolase [Mesorhizobium sp. M4B.F.Ca.ET.215.01.1.1]TGQ41909.1 HAD-IIB family hydrolase [Mesorhizobium sp. M4B.F.Ca.ET.214.01.1.1]